MKYKLKLCSGCIEDMRSNWRLLIPRSMVEFIEVEIDECFHCDLDTYNQKCKELNPDWESYWKQYVHENPEIILEILQEIYNMPDQTYD